VKAHTFWRLVAVVYSARGGRLSPYARSVAPIKPALGATPFFVQKFGLHGLAHKVALEQKVALLNQKCPTSIRFKNAF
jgi:hypothetical protein